MSQFKKSGILLLGFPLSALLLSLIQPPYAWHGLAWICLVPFLLACYNSTIPIRFLYGTAYITAVCYWLLALHWLNPITRPGWIVFSMYTALLWPITTLVIRYCIKKRVPLFIISAMVFVGAERLQGWPLGGFFWRLLAHSQYQNSHWIQIADIFGAFGVSFLIALINGIIAEFIINFWNKRLFTIRNLLILLFGIISLAATWLYGSWRINQTTTSVYEGPKIAAIQSNVPQSVKDSTGQSDVMFDELLGMSEEAIDAGAQVIVWPETMVQYILDESIQGRLTTKYQEACSRIHQALSDHAQKKAYVVIGAYGGRIRQGPTGEELAKYNSVYIYGPDGRISPKRYDKIHLLVFGEYMPFRQSWPWLFRQLLKCSPYDYDYSLYPGTYYTRFNIDILSDQEKKPFQFGTIICYEDTLPGIARNYAQTNGDTKKADWLVNISNDGWFVRFENQQVKPSAELSQHVAACVFRSIETRLSILRCVNTGISCVIDSCGRLHNSYETSSTGFPQQVMRRQGIAGWFSDRMPIDTRTSFFSKHGQWLDSTCAIGLGVLTILSLYQGIRTKKRAKSEP